MPDAIVDISVTVYETLDKAGNAANGDYSYLFVPDVVTVTESNTTLRYVLDEASAEAYSITGLYSTDSRFQLASPIVSEDGKSLSVVNSNSQPQLIYVALQVVHLDTQRKLSLDPQVINVPPGRPSM